MQQNTQVMSLHANKRITLNNIIFNKRNLRRAKTFELLRASIEITKQSTNKFYMFSVLADTGAQ